MTKDLEKPQHDPRVVRMVWKNLDKKNVRQLAEMTGLSAQEILTLRNELMEAPDALTLDQQIQKHIIDLREISDRAREEFETTPDARSKAPLLASSISAIKLVLTQIEKIQKMNQGNVDALNAVRQRELVELMRFVVDGLAKWSEEQGVDQNAFYERANDLLLEGAEAMEERNA